MKILPRLVAVLLLFVLPALADDGQHHEDLTANQLGTVHFPVSCDAKVQQNFERGVALLHSFWYDEVETQFTQIAKDDPKCAMAHWGIAMGMWHQLWNHPDDKVIAKGLAEVKKAEALHAKTARERDYIAAMDAFYSGKRDHDARALAYSNAMEGVYKNYPEDREAAAFYALSLLASEPDHDTTFANRKKAASILEVLFAEAPDHPGVAHYLIHSYDKPQLAQLGLPAARRYAAIAPASPHALHMPSHIFARLGLWQDDINSNVASIAATRKTAALHMGGEGHQFHAMDFLVYAYLQSGREAEAQGVVDEIKAMPVMHDDMYGSDFNPQTYALSVFPAHVALELRHWQEAASLQPVDGGLPSDHVITYWARAIGAARSGNLVQAYKDVAEIERVHQALLDKKKPMFGDAAEDYRQEAMAWINHAEGKNDEATAALRALAEKEEASGAEVGDIPAREMLADMLMEMNQPEHALAEYETDLKFNPGRFDGLYGAAHVAQIAHQNDKANTYLAQLVKSCEGSNSSRPELAQAKQLLAQK